MWPTTMKMRFGDKVRSVFFLLEGHEKVIETHLKRLKDIRKEISDSIGFGKMFQIESFRSKLFFIVL